MLQNCSMFRVFLVFSREPTRMHGIREISRKAGLSPTSVRIWLGRLEEQGLISKREGKYVANREAEGFISMKTIANLFMLHHSGLVSWLERQFPRAAVLFGSYRYGYDREDSDIDIAVIGGSVTGTERFEDVLGRGIHITEVQSLEDMDGEMRRSVINGIVLVGEL